MPKELKFEFPHNGKSGFAINARDYYILELIAEQEYIQKERALTYQLHVWIVITQLDILLKYSIDKNKEKFIIKYAFNSHFSRMWARINP